jgi:hypothetical protein
MDNMRTSSAFAVLAVMLGTSVLVGQTAASPARAGKAETDYRLDEGIGGAALHGLGLYPGAGYRSFVEAKFMVSSLADLESRITQLPRGTTLHWLPHAWEREDIGINPLLFAKGQYEQFRQFCSDRGIKILIERTYQSHLDADGSFARTVLALTEKGKTPLEFRSVKVHVASHAGGNEDRILRMLYDPESKLSYWEVWDFYPGYSPGEEAMLADQQLWSRVIYIASDQMAIFQAMLGAELRIDVGREHHDSLSQVQASAIRALERKTAPPFRKFLTFDKQVPPDFLKQCMTDVYMPHIESVQGEPNGWQVTFASQNGNIALLSLDDSYNLISTKVTLNPNSDSVGGCKR